MTTLKNVKIFTESNVIENGYIRFSDTIEEIGVGDVDGIDMSGCSIIPGFIDQHVHGLKHCDVMDATVNSLQQIAHLLPQEGTTSFLATTMTETKDNIEKALKNIKRCMDEPVPGSAEILGVHLEGPFISELYKGAQRGDAIQEISIALFDAYNNASGGNIKEVTIAPELEHANDLIKHLSKQSIVASIGHTGTTGEEALQAIENGCKCFTHAYNAMSKLHHRDIGAVGAMLLTDTYAEVICDKVHLSDDAVRLLYQIKTPEKLILVTDSMRAKLLVPGEYDLGGQTVVVDETSSRLIDGALAGSILRMEDGVKNFKEITNATMEELIQVSSINPAILHDVYDRKGSIKVGKDADINIVDSELNIVKTYCKGR